MPRRPEHQGFIQEQNTTSQTDLKLQAIETRTVPKNLSKLANIEIDITDESKTAYVYVDYIDDNNKHNYCKIKLDALSRAAKYDNKGHEFTKSYVANATVQLEGNKNYLILKSHDNNQLFKHEIGIGAGLGSVQYNNGILTFNLSNNTQVTCSIKSILDQLASIQGQVNVIRNDLDEEINRAKNALTAEIIRAKNAETTVSSNLSNEVSRAKTSEQQINQALATEINRAKQTENALSSSLNTETARAKQAESTLNGNLNTETARAKAAESAVNTAIVATNKTISDEVNRAKKAESNINTALATTNVLLEQEIARAKAKEGELDTTISQTAAAASSARSVLSTRINTVNNNVTELATSLDEEVARAKAAEADANGAITVLQNTIQEHKDSQVNDTHYAHKQIFEHAINTAVEQAAVSAASKYAPIHHTHTAAELGHHTHESADITELDNTLNTKLADYATKDYVDTNGGKIDTVKVNGTALSIDNKAVDINITWDSVQNKPDIASLAHTHAANDIIETDEKQFISKAEKEKLAGIESDAQVNKIEVIKVNGSEVSITDKTVDLGTIAADVPIETISVNGTQVDPVDKNVNITIPTKLSELTNDGSFVNEDYVNTHGGKIDTVSVNGGEKVGPDADKNIDLTIPQIEVNPEGASGGELNKVKINGVIYEVRGGTSSAIAYRTVDSTGVVTLDLNGYTSYTLTKSNEITTLTLNTPENITPGYIVELNFNGKLRPQNIALVNNTGKQITFTEYGYSVGHSLSNLNYSEHAYINFLFNYDGLSFTCFTTEVQY